MKKLLTILCIVALVSVYACTLIACQPDNGYEEVEGKTNIRVATYDGGLGKEWLEIAAKQFEKKYENAHFEEGKTGVAVHVEFCSSADMLVNQSLKSNVYLTELFDYYTWVNDDKVADITDVVTGSLKDEFGEDQTIEDNRNYRYRRHDNCCRVHGTQTFDNYSYQSGNGRYRGQHDILHSRRVCSSRRPRSYRLQV